MFSVGTGIGSDTRAVETQHYCRRR